MDIRISHALPNQAYSNQDISEWAIIDQTFIEKKIGVNKRYFLDKHETTSDLAVAACRKLLEDNPSAQDNIPDALILVTQTPDHAIPHTSAIVHGKLGLPDRVACFDISLGCSGYVYALSVCKGLMLGEGYRRILLVTCDPYSKIINRSDRDTVTIFSDAAAATMISNNDGNVTLGYADMGTCGKKYDYLIVKKSGLNGVAKGIWNDSKHCDINEEHFISMHGRGIYNFVMANVPNSIRACLTKNRLTLEDIDYFCFHQASKFILTSLTEKLNIENGKVLSNLQSIGNTVSSSIPILLENGLSSNLFKGKTVMICGFGVGLSWACNILKFKQG